MLVNFYSGGGTWYQAGMDMTLYEIMMIITNLSSHGIKNGKNLCASMILLKLFNIMHDNSQHIEEDIMQLTLISYPAPPGECGVGSIPANSDA
jgi:hypothetical protein